MHKNTYIYVCRTHICKRTCICYTRMSYTFTRLYACICNLMSTLMCVCACTFNTHLPTHAINCVL